MRVCAHMTLPMHRADSITAKCKRRPSAADKLDVTQGIKVNATGEAGPGGADGIHIPDDCIQQQSHVA